MEVEMGKKKRRNKHFSQVLRFDAWRGGSGIYGSPEDGGNPMFLLMALNLRCI